MSRAQRGLVFFWGLPYTWWKSGGQSGLHELGGREKCTGVFQCIAVAPESLLKAKQSPYLLLINFHLLDHIFHVFKPLVMANEMEKFYAQRFAVNVLIKVK